MTKLLIIKYRKAIRFLNVGEEGPVPHVDANFHRHWHTCIAFGCLSAGQGRVYSNQLERLEINDIVAAYRTGHGYVGIGVVESLAIPIWQFEFQNNYLNKFPQIDKKLFINSQLFPNGEENPKSEYVISVDWLKTVYKEEAYWEQNAGLFAKSNIQSNLQNQFITISFLERKFNVKFEEH